MARYRKHHYFLAACLAMFGLCLAFVNYVPSSIQAATITWDGGGADGTCGGGVGDGNKWSCALNWSGDVIPGSSDVVTFNATSTKNATIDQAFSIQSLNMNAGYTGTVTQSADLTVSINFVHNTLNGLFTGSSGTLTFSGGTAADWTIGRANDSFFNVNLNKDDGIAVTVTSLEALVNGTLTLTNGSLNLGTVATYGPVTHTATFDGGSGSLLFYSLAAQTVNLVGGGHMPYFELTVANTTINGPTSGTVTFDGLAVVSAGNFVGGDGNLIFTGGLSLEASGAITLGSGTITATGIEVYDGTFTAGAGNIDLSQFLIVQLPAVFTAPSGTLFIGTDMDVADGAFVHNNGTVVFDGTNQTILHAGTFYNLTKTAGGGDTLTLPEAATITVENNLVLQGTSAASRLSIRSSTPGVQALIDSQAARTAQYLDVMDSNNTSTAIIVCDLGCINSGNNLRWTFMGGDSAGGSSVAVEYLSPQGGHVLQAGEGVDITWGTSATAGEFINLDISFDGGLTFAPLFTGIDNDRSQTWTVPDVDSTEVIILITSTNGVTELARDSSTPFTIVGAPDTGTDADTDAPVTPITPVFTHNFIRGKTFSTVYYIDADGVRHSIFNEAIYFTYEDSWDRVEMVADSILANYPLGNNLLPKAGVVLVKIKSANTVYATDASGSDTLLRAITDEAQAANLYGSQWADYIIDLEPTLWSEFTLGEPLPLDADIDQSILKKRADLHI